MMVDLCCDAQVRSHADRVRHRAYPMEIVRGVHVPELERGPER